MKMLPKVNIRRHSQCLLIVIATQEVAVPQHTEQPPSPQAVLKHQRSTVHIGET